MPSSPSNQNIEYLHTVAPYQHGHYVPWSFRHVFHQDQEDHQQQVVSNGWPALFRVCRQTRSEAHSMICLPPMQIELFDTRCWEESLSIPYSAYAVTLEWVRAQPYAKIARIDSRRAVVDCDIHVLNTWVLDGVTEPHAPDHETVDPLAFVEMTRTSTTLSLKCGFNLRAININPFKQPIRDWLRGRTELNVFDLIRVALLLEAYCCSHRIWPVVVPEDLIEAEDGELCRSYAHWYEIASFEVPGIEGDSDSEVDDDSNDEGDIEEHHSGTNHDDSEGAGGVDG